MKDPRIEMNELEVSTITKTSHGYELTDRYGDIIGSFKDWESVAAMFRKQDFSEEYIAKRLADLNRLAATTIDETNE
jgi:hypothetical protein